MSIDSRAWYAEEHIGRFDIAVEDAVLVSVIHGFGQRQEHLCRDTRRKWSGMLAPPLVQRWPIAKLDGEITGAVVVSSFIHRNDVGMIKPGQSLRLAEKAAAGVGIGQQTGSRQL